MKAMRFFGAMLIVSLVVVAASQIFSVKAATTRSFTLYGSYTFSGSAGWGFTASNITIPGPTLIVEQGDTVNLTLISNGGTHRFFVSYTNSSSPNSTEPQSPDFELTTINYQFVATDAVGTYTYGCYYHYSMGMYGTFEVVPTGTIPEFTPLAMLAILMAVTTGFALVYRRKCHA